MTEQEYYAKLSELDAQNIQDNRNRYDLFRCKHCHDILITTCTCKGYRPKVIQCPKCSFGAMHYERSAHSVKPNVEVTTFRRPTFAEFHAMSKRLKVQNLDGLLIILSKNFKKQLVYLPI